MISFLLAVLGHAYLPSISWGSYFLIILTLGTVGLWWGSTTLRSHLLFALIGFVVAQWHAVDGLSKTLPISVEPEEFEIEGTVINLQPQGSGGFQSLLLDIESAPVQLMRVERVRLGLYDSEVRIAAGDHIKVLAKVGPLNAYQNEFSPDRRRKEFAQGIGGSGYVKQLIKHEQNSSIRQGVHDWLNHNMSQSTSALMSALVLGYRGDLDDSQWELLRVSGTVHLAVVSGLHLGVMCLTGLLLGRLVVVSIQYLDVRPTSIIQTLPVLCAISLASFYLWFGGFGVPLQRAWIMAICLLLPQLFARRIDSMKRLKIALFLVLVYEPLSILEIGFWLSFSLVGLLIQFANWRNGYSRLIQIFAVQLFLTLLMLPILLFGLGQFNLGGALSNLWAIPYVSLFVALLPLTLALVGIFEPILAFYEIWASGFWHGLSFHSLVGLHAQWQTPAIFGLFVSLLALVLLFLPGRLKVLSLLLLLPLLTPKQNRPDASEFVVRLLDVGQGLSILIETREGVTVYDLAAKSRSGWIAAQATLFPTLRALGYRELDLIVSHSDVDHSGGLERTLKQFSVPRFYSGQPALTGGTACASQNWKKGEVRFQLYALKNQQSDNDQSCVLHIENGRCSILIAGDMSSRAEIELLNQHRLAPVTWLVLSHHGSHSSSSGVWLDQLLPEAAIASRGKHNRFGHPNESVKQRLADRGITLLDTAEQGEIVLTATQDQCLSDSFANLYPRYWRTH
jgi:competence protein ComEC